MNQKKPSSVKATPELADFMTNLDKESELGKITVKAKEELSEDMFAGESVQKRQIPKCYIRKFGVNNLYVMDLDASRRLCYTLVYNGTGICVVLLEIFLSHREYNKRFGYD